MPHLLHILSCNTGHTQRALLSPGKFKKDACYRSFVNT